MYDRKLADRELNFEASGALMDASLVMRDRETDSWWSIMTATAIGGALAGSELVELPWGEKTTWGDWRARHPDTLVLSVGGEEHVAENPYDGYFASEETFRGLRVPDRRLEPKAPIFSFRLGGVAYAAPHRAIEGGKLFAVAGGDGRRIFLYRPPGAPLFASTRAWRVAEELATELAAELAAGADPEALLSRLEAGGAEPLTGFDTFWYNWIAVHPESELLR